MVVRWLCLFAAVTSCTETLAMKGLVLNAMGKKDEGMELAKLGIRKDMM